MLADSAEIIAHLWVGCVQLRHHALVGVGGIAGIRLRVFWPLQREGKTVKPVAIAGRLLIPNHILKSPEAPAAVVEHAVYDDTDTLVVQSLDHPAHGFIPAEARIDVHIVHGIIFVVLTCSKDRV